MKAKFPPLTYLLGLSLLIGACLLFVQWRPGPGDAARGIPIQHEGRVKSFDAFSRQTINLITEKETWNGKPALDSILEALVSQDKIGITPWIKINTPELLSYLGLPEDRNFFAFNEIYPSLDKLQTLVKQARAKRDADLRPSLLEQKAETLYERMITVKQLMTGESVRVIPPPAGENVWLSPYDSQGPFAERFKHLMDAYGEKKYDSFALEAREWTRDAHEATSGKFRLSAALEILYLKARPFQCAWVAYLLSFLSLSVFKRYGASRLLGGPALITAIFFHTGGLVLRILILSRPPVSNMYESMIYMNWVLIAAAVVFSVIRKNWSAASVGALISAIVMIYGNLLPIDTSLEVLVPVLRSNYWLTIHVMTIVSSYGILGLAMGLGHRHLFLDVSGKWRKKDIAESAELIYRVIQIGVLLLGIGTVLGGVWANESWGRFWGWDPKETWALITFLGYLVVIHLKYAKVLSPFTLALGAILGFELVLMTWYGVNFVLGRGLHSYGRGSGGIAWVLYFLLFEAFFVGWVLFKKRREEDSNLRSLAG